MYSSGLIHIEQYHVMPLAIMVKVPIYIPLSIINSSNICGTSTLVTYYLNFTARQDIMRKVPEVKEDSILAYRSCSYI